MFRYYRLQFIELNFSCFKANSEFWQVSLMLEIMIRNVKVKHQIFGMFQRLVIRIKFLNAEQHLLLI